MEDLDMDANPKRIYWLSRHKPVSSQINNLKELFGNNTIIIEDIKPFRTIEEIIERFNKYNCDDLVVSAPLSIYHKLCEHGIHPLYPIIVKAMTGEEADYKANGNWYKHIDIKRVMKLELKLADPILTKVRG